ncbi:unnamed protein product [Choristocarpus tenellus]
MQRCLRASRHITRAYKCGKTSQVTRSYVLAGRTRSGWSEVEFKQDWTGCGKVGGVGLWQYASAIREASTNSKSKSASNSSYRSSGIVRGKRMTFKTGKIAMLADGAVMGSLGDTVVLATVVSNRGKVDESGLLPLQVEYREKMHASGRIPRTHYRREGQPTNAELLAARALDRVLRPMFPPGYCYDTQIIVTVQAIDPNGKADPVLLAINTASAALLVSNVPWDGPAGCVRIGREDGKLVVNPPLSALLGADWKSGGGLDLLYAGNKDRTLMIEMGGGPVPEGVLTDAIQMAHKKA